MKLTIFTLYDQAYSGYAEMWRYCINRAYPEYNAVCCLEAPKTRWGTAVKRFLVTPLGWAGEDVYITDIDLMILPEKQSIYDFHHAEMDFHCLCYSNSPRDNDELHSFERLTGLHYATKEWYRRTEEHRATALHLLNNNHLGNQRIDDEITLKNICLLSGVGIPPKRNLLKRHHGVHLGVIRAWKKHGIQTVRTKLRIRVTPERALEWQRVVAEPQYKEILGRIQDKEIRREFEMLDKFTKGRMKQ